MQLKPSLAATLPVAMSLDPSQEHGYIRTRCDALAGIRLNQQH